jgi:hypothetical protein
VSELERDIIALLEQELGLIETGTRVPSVNGVQIVLCSPDVDGNRTLSTLGLHRNEYTTAQGSVPISLEIIVELTQSCSVNQLARLLEFVVSQIAARSIPAPSRGSYIPLPARISLRQEVVGLYFTNPILRSKCFRDMAADMSLVVAWMIPITAPELRILEDAGWTALESYWDNRDSISLRSVQDR